MSFDGAGFVSFRGGRCWIGGGNRRRLTGRCTGTTGRGGSAKGSLQEMVVTSALTEEKYSRFSGLTSALKIRVRNGLYKLGLARDL